VSRSRQTGRARTGDSTVVHEDRVEKVVFGEFTEAVRRHEVLFRVGERSGLFRAPRVLSKDETTKVIVLERLALGRPLRDEYVRALERKTLDARLCECVRVLARIAGAIHGVGGEIQGNNSFFHGDFGFSNVFLCEEGGVQLIDPMPTPFTAPSSGSLFPGEAYDVATMMGCLLGRVPPSRLSLLFRTGTERMSYAALLFSEYARHRPAWAFDELVELACERFLAYSRASFGHHTGPFVAGLMFWGLSKE
jgi:hypothetical protein